MVIITISTSSGTGIYPHMPIIRPHAARFHERRISSVMFTLAHLYGNVYIPLDVARALADSFDFGLLGEQSSQKWETPCPGRRWTAAQSLTPLALFSAEKSVTVQTNKQTNKQWTIYPHLAYRHVWITKFIRHATTEAVLCAQLGLHTFEPVL